jgi:hypothetical protein
VRGVQAADWGDATMTTAEHLVVLSVMAAEGRAVPRDVLLYEHGEEAFLGALWSGPLHERWRADVREGTEVYYAGPEAAVTRPWGVFPSGARDEDEVFSL